MDKKYLSVLVENKSGVLSRISGLIARRGFNIDSLTVCATEDDAYSRMTIALIADDRTLTQIGAQLAKQEEVVKVVELNPEESVLRELLLIKVGLTPDTLSELSDISTVFKAKVIDLGSESMTLELTGRGSKLDSFINILRKYGIIELARSGASALLRGETALKDSI